MNIIPLISIKEGNLFDGKEGNQLSVDDVFKRVEKDSVLYVVDFDGIERNNAHLDLYQKLADHSILWVDAGPRRLDDVMDFIMAGATNITIRKNLWPEPDIPGVREITEDEIYLLIDEDHKEHVRDLSFVSDIDGIVVFGNDDLIADDFTFRSSLKDASTKYKIYLADADPMNIAYWSEHGVTGILVDLNKREGYR